MCLNLFFKTVHKQEQDLNTSAFDEKFQEEVLKQMRVRVSGKIYLNADDLLKYFGWESLKGVLENIDNPEEVKSKLIPYKRVKTSIENYALLPEFCLTDRDFNNPEVHYAFDDRILPFLEKTSKNDKKTEYLYRQAKKEYERISKM